MYKSKVESGGKEKKHIIVIGKDTYEVPLMGDAPYQDIETATSGWEGYKTFLEKHIPPEVVAQLSVKQLLALLNDWGKYSKDDMGITPGES